MTCVFAVMLKFCWLIRVSRYNVDGEQVISPGTVNIIGSSGEVPVYPLTGPVLEGRNGCKNHDKFMHFIVRVMVSFILLIL